MYLLPLFLVACVCYKLKNNTINNTNKKTEKVNNDSENKLDGVACLNTYKNFAILIRILIWILIHSMKIQM